MNAHAWRWLAWFLAVSPFAASAGAPDIVLRFPQDRSVGLVETRPKLSTRPLEKMFDDWQTISDATGVVVVPNGQEVRLQVDRAGGSD
jgi:hypothetical protein